ncbi:DEAD/DEAH box helicase family protein [Parasphingorhabdus flavimaris]|uniref:DEAD/DEAH box helicase family protein n=1 Tax=Parasphingorhabdus flavimaris TaxID=266812 RepID=A0ABX2N5X3_9SPHN|nr:helicase-related protein [Parasphingorhabdus flavimaris]NVD29117.1 DEAD/DEAH box helicase family protein [Parasphingorhabdus flavimaris]
MHPNPGDRVRMRRDPAFVGIVMDRPFERDGRLMIKIDVLTGQKEVPLSLLEIVESEPDILNDLKMGKFSTPLELRRTINHLRLSGKLADMIYSMGATNTKFFAYQFKPLLKILNAPARGLLIADEVGLGKTIEAGLIWTELVARGDARRLLVVCPKPLVKKWQDELRRKFSVNAKACNAEELLGLIEDDALNRNGFAAVASMSALKPPAKWNDEEEPNQSARADLARFLSDERGDELFDLVIFDEAHHLRNTQTANHKIGQLLTESSDYSLLLSATPVNLRSNDLRVLLKLLDPDTFDNEWQFAWLQEENAPLVEAFEAARNPNVSIEKISKLVGALQPGQILKTGERLKRLRAELADGIEGTAKERMNLAARLEEMSLLGSIVNRTRRRDVVEFKVVRHPKTVSWEMSEKFEREFYDEITQAIERYAYDRDINEKFLLAGAQRLVASSLAAAYRHWGERTGNLSVDEEDEETLKPLPGPMVSTLGEYCSDHLFLAKLEQNDGKFDSLIKTLRDLLSSDSTEKIIIFSSFRSVISYLSRRLAAENIDVIELHGGIKEDRQETVGRFADAPGGTILLTSEVGGEGLDLQFCRIVINWDLPWNPMKLEQRIGRVDRIGQQSASVEIINLIAQDTIEEIVYKRLYERLDIIRNTLGDFEPILGDVVKQIELILSDGSLSLRERKEELDRATAAAEEVKRQTEQLELEAPSLIAHGENILNRINEAHAPHKMLASNDLRDYVISTLVEKFPGTRFDRVPDVSIEMFEVRLSHAAQAKFSRFLTDSATRYQTRFRGDNGSGVRVVFGSNSEPGRYRAIDSIVMKHPLTRFAAVIREELYSGVIPRPVTAFTLSSPTNCQLEPGFYAIAIERWSIDGLLPVDKLSFLGADCLLQRLVTSEEAEKLLMEAIATNPDLIEVDQNTLNHACEAIENLVLPMLERRREDFFEAEAARHFDQIQTQIALAQEHRERKRKEAESIIRDLEFSWGDVSQKDKRLRVAKMRRSQLDKFLARMDEKLEDLKVKEDNFIIDEPQVVGIAIIELEAAS